MPANKLAQLEPPRNQKERQQVAAVCYRHHKRGVEFLLVQTRGGRWIFPKGGVEMGLTHAESAALEAFEEAGVHGRMEKIPFARYFHHKPGASVRPDLAVTVHLCEVSYLEAPQESNRHPTWFCAEKAKRRLRERRDSEFGDQLAGVIDRATSRIRRLRPVTESSSSVRVDGLQKVRFEASDREPGILSRHQTETTVSRYLFRQRSADSPAVEVAVQAHLRRISQIDSGKNAQPIRTTPVEDRPILRLGPGTKSLADATRNITAIDSVRRENSPSRGNRRSNKRRAATNPLR
jgi:8-oxo-dGTP pyrophosphatase MutT (NUDIX family)